MIQLLINASIISFIFAFISYSGFVEQFKVLLWKLFNGKIQYRYYSLKPFDCCLCSTWWTVLIYGLFTNVSFLYVILISAMAAYSSPIVSRLLDYIFNLITKILK